MTVLPTETSADNMLPRLYERDIDVLLQEELLFNENVRNLFAEKIGLGGSLRIVRCDLSVYDANTGETDVLASYSTRTSKGVVLIENKIDAAFQPQQPERYRIRADSLKAKNGGDAFTVLMAPSAYLRSTEQQFAIFDAGVTYEDFANAVGAEASERAHHRAALVRRAIEYARSSFVVVPAPEVTAFWMRIFEIADRNFPELQMPRPKEKGAYSNWIIFKADLPRKITIDWKVTKGAVELNFWKSAPHKPIPSIDLAGLGAKSDVVGESTVIRIFVSAPQTKWTELTNEQIIEALNAAATLLRFYRSNPTSFA